MSEPTTSNLAFAQRIIDTVHDANVLDGLVSSGILPQSFQSFVCTLDLTTFEVTSTVASLIDDRTGSQVVLAEGQQVVVLRGGAAETVAAEGNLTSVQIGLAPSATGALTDELSAATAGSAVNSTGVVLASGTNGGVVGDTNLYLVAQVVVGNAVLTTGELKVFVVVV